MVGVFCCDDFQEFAECGGGFTPRENFCPWCGADHRLRHPLEVSARRVVSLMYEERGEWDELKDAVAEMGALLDKMK